MSLMIRKATVADSVEYEKLISEVFLEDLDTLCPRTKDPTILQVREWMSRHDGEDSVVLLAFRENELQGVLNISRFSRRNLSHSAGLGLNVRRHARGKGVGRRLLASAIDWYSRNDHIERLELEVVDGNLAAQHLYRAFGFVIEGIKKSAVRKECGYFDLHLMALKKNL